ncbi:hypothetical protein [Thaumasiovibrio sp. DFM-14]
MKNGFNVTLAGYIISKNTYNEAHRPSLKYNNSYKSNYDPFSLNVAHACA